MKGSLERFYCSLQRLSFSPPLRPFCCGRIPPFSGELKRSFRNIAKSSTVTKDDQAIYIKEKPNEILLEREPFKLVKETTVLSFGDGSHGALGHVVCFGGDAYEPGTVEGLPSDIVSVGTGHYHSLAVTKSGELWAWGRNSEGQLGSRDTDSRELWHQPHRVKGLENTEVERAVGSGVVSMAIARDGSLWAWGKSKRGQLGLGPDITQALAPQQVKALAGQHVAQVALGWGHALARTTEGHLYSWGYAADGRLGFSPRNLSSIQNVLDDAKLHNSAHGRTATKQELAEKQVELELEREKIPVLAWEPLRVGALSAHHVKEIACGFDHSLALNDQGQLFSFGDNTLQQLGRTIRIFSSQSSISEQGLQVDRVSGPLTNRRIVAIGGGLGHSLAVDTEGLVFSWGWNAGLQLGRDTADGYQLPAEIEDLRGQGVSIVDGGRVHSLALTSKGEIWLWGSGKNGRLGLGSPGDEPVPFPVESLEGVTVLQAACGMDHTLVLVEK